MKKPAIILAGILFAAALTNGCGAVFNRTSVPDITGTWNGAVESESGNIQQGVMKIMKNTDGTFSGMLVGNGDMPDTPVNVITLEGNSIHFEIPAMNGVFDGVVDNTGSTIHGKWLINAITFKVSMVKE